MKASGLLLKAKAKLDEDSWIQGFSALTKNGEMVSTSDRRACKFCASGALSSVASTPKYGLVAFIEAAEFLDDAVIGKYKGDIVSFNDAKGRKLEQVLKIFDRAAAAAKKVGK